MRLLKEPGLPCLSFQYPRCFTLCQLAEDPHRRVQRLLERRTSRVFPSHAREETRESRGMPCLFLNTERGFGGKPPKNRGFVGILRGQKCLKRGQKCLERRFSRRSPVGEWSRGARSMPRVFGRGSRSQPAALVSDRDDAA